MLIDKYGLTAKDPYNFTVYERAAPLTDNLAESLAQTQHETHLACAAPQQGYNPTSQDLRQPGIRSTRTGLHPFMVSTTRQRALPLNIRS